MIDIKLIRENKDLVKENIKKKFQDEKLDIVDEIFDMDIKYRDAKMNGDNLRNEKNKLSSTIGTLMKEKKIEEANVIKNKVKEMQDEIDRLSNLETDLETEIRNKMMIIPNIIDESVPIGKDDSENVEIEKFGEPVVPKYVPPLPSPAGLLCSNIF